MKKQNLMFAAIVMAVMLSVSAVFAQDPKMDMSKMPKGEMNMMEMHKDGHHMLMKLNGRSRGMNIVGYLRWYCLARSVIPASFLYLQLLKLL